MVTLEKLAPADAAKNWLMVVILPVLSAVTRAVVVGELGFAIINWWNWKDCTIAVRSASAMV